MHARGCCVVENVHARGYGVLGCLVKAYLPLDHWTIIHVLYVNMMSWIAHLTAGQLSSLHLDRPASWGLVLPYDLPNIFFMFLETMDGRLVPSFPSFLTW